MIVKTFSGVMNKISTMPGAVCEADRPTSPEPAENPVNEYSAALVDGDSSTCEDVDKFDIEYDLWYPEEQVGFDFIIVAKVYFTCETLVTFVCLYSGRKAPSITFL